MVIKRLIDKFSSAILLALGFCFLAILLLQTMTGALPQTTSNSKTYFLYSKSELARLAEADSNLKMSAAELQHWENVATSLAKSKRIPPTSTARMYAYMSVAARDAYLLSLQSSGSAKGSLGPIMAAVLCEFYDEACNSSVLTRNDNYSRALAEIVHAKVVKRMKDEAERALAGVRGQIVPSGQEYWAGLTPVTPDSKYWQPWHMLSQDQFRAPPPPAYGSEEDSIEVQAVRNALEQITEEQRLAAVFWAQDTPASLWAEIANVHIRDSGISLGETIEVKYALHTTMADAFIACWDTKYTYWTPRPNMRGLQRLTAVPTPNFPSYTSGHSTVSAAAAVVLSHYFPEQTSVWESMAIEAKDSRLWSGIHFPVDNERGFEMGKKLGAHSLEAIKGRQ